MRPTEPLRALPEFVLVLSIAACGPLAAQEPAVDAPDTAVETHLVEVFREGEDDYASFRIPALVRAADGALLAFAEGRVHGRGDSGDIDLVMKRSVDGGRTWGELSLVADHGEGCIGNPTPVVERHSGHVVLLATMQPPGCHESEIRAGKAGSRFPCVLRSEDHGRTWSEPVSLEASCDRAEWRWYATGPCHAIQLRHGEHAGRLVVPANHSTDGGGANAYLSAHALLSDDGGRSWRIGAVDAHEVASNAVNPNESTVAELADGRLIFHCRNHGSDAGPNRLVAYSDDGGESFTAPYRPEPQLVAPVCQGALLAVAVPASEPSADDGADDGADAGRAEPLLLFSGPGHPSQRTGLRIRLSTDAGRTWRDGPLLHAGGSAYSDLVDLGAGGADECRVGCLFEADGYARIVFSTFDAAQLRAPR